MGLRIFGLGVGVLILLIVWIASLSICMILSRHRGMQSGILYPIIATLITLLLYFWPREKCIVEYKAQIRDALTKSLDPSEIQIPSESAQSWEVDYLAIPKLAFLIFLIILTVVCTIKYLHYKLFQPQLVRQLPRLKIE